jgi:hypothetical protein
MGKGRNADDNDPTTPTTTKKVTLTVDCQFSQTKNRRRSDRRSFSFQKNKADNDDITNDVGATIN